MSQTGFHGHDIHFYQTFLTNIYYIGVCKCEVLFAPTLNLPKCVHFYRGPTGSGNLDKVWKIISLFQGLEKVWKMALRSGKVKNGLEN
jgi:hypothetical protein